MRKIIIGIIMMTFAINSLGVMVNRSKGLEFEKVEPIMVKENIIIYEESFNWIEFTDMLEEFMITDKKAKELGIKELTVEIGDFGKYKAYYNLTYKNSVVILYDTMGDKNIVLDIHEMSEIVNIINEVKM